MSILKSIQAKETQRGFITDHSDLMLEMYQETPPAIEGEVPRSALDAMHMPGCCVKSLEKEKRGGFPKYFGKLCALDKKMDLVGVVGAAYMPEQEFIWLGTYAEYLRVWECD